jgi:hypothetical protein
VRAELLPDAVGEKLRPAAPRTDINVKMLAVSEQLAEVAEDESPSARLGFIESGASGERKVGLVHPLLQRALEGQAQEKKESAAGDYCPGYSSAFNRNL